MSIYICTYIYIHIFTHTHTHAHAHTPPRTHTRTHTHTHMYTHTHLCICLSTYLSIYLSIDICIFISLCMYACRYVCVYMCVGVCACVCISTNEFNKQTDFLHLLSFCLGCAAGRRAPLAAQHAAGANREGHRIRVDAGVIISIKCTFLFLTCNGEAIPGKLGGANPNPTKLKAHGRVNPTKAYRRESRL